MPIGVVHSAIDESPWGWHITSDALNPRVLHRLGCVVLLCSAECLIAGKGRKVLVFRGKNGAVAGN